MLAKQLGGSIKSYTDVEEIEEVDPLVLTQKKCHIFAPCANHGTLNSKIAMGLKTKCVIELATCATTFNADEVL